MSGERLRALARDVFIYDLQDFDTLLGGLVLTAGVTNTNFYTMVNIIINVSPQGPFFLQDDNATTVAQDTQALLPGRYFVVADGTIQNGLLLRDDIHTLFDFYDFSIYPDDGYKIVCFQTTIISQELSSMLVF
ncbi:hypothetical protein B0H67DRAFT_553521 [Lasiosphaeris hirsuta]|uniref:DUF7881 domain-containing protein n=1 Tax=Lasiosphaeris hirsuta TaxID=260670 RepID=A0AA40DVD7_9PEZI|nr:hypothetical protein B0H67DRAFT_553521 [Lasiosphaeris hirsuta]